MSPEQLLALLQAAYAKVSGGSLRLCREQHIVDQLGLDSLQRMELVHDLEQALEIEIVGEQRLLEVKTVGDLVDLLVALTDGMAAGINQPCDPLMLTADPR